VSGDMKMVRPLIEVFDEVKKFSFPRTGVDKMATITFRSETLYYYQIKLKGYKVATNMVVAPAGLEPATFCFEGRHSTWHNPNKNNGLEKSIT
jgi:hypothetical protein